MDFHISGFIVKTTLELPDDLLRQAKAMAALRGQTMTQLFTESLQNTLDLPGAVLPSAKARSKAAIAFDKELQALAKKVGSSWVGKETAVAAVRKQRRG
jgi:hypothetical protein